MNMRRANSAGFSLLEVSVVLLIMGLLLGSVMRPMASQFREQNRKTTLRQLQALHESLIGFASARGRLPCPVTVSGGDEDCSIAHGYVPAELLGVQGSYNSEGLLIDSWGAPIRYSVSMVDSDNNGVADFTGVDEMRRVGIGQLQAGFTVCSSGTCDRTRANQVPAVLLSTGSRAVNSSADEVENIDGDNRFVSKDPVVLKGEEFDDIVVWVSPNILVSRLIQAAILP